MRAPWLKLKWLYIRLRCHALSGPLGRVRDNEIDAQLARARMTRVGLFTPAGALTPHRRRMVHMMIAFDIDVARSEERQPSTSPEDV